MAGKKKVTVEAPAESEKKGVWIKCRATASCEGNEAEIVSSQENHLTMETIDPTNPNPRSKKKTNTTILAGGGRVTRYRCLSCKRSFTIST